jgi:hypothetical protein
MLLSSMALSKKAGSAATISLYLSDHFIQSVLVAAATQHRVITFLREFSCNITADTGTGSNY